MVKCYGVHEDVLFDILLYLPIMSLLRFKSVCKSWRSIIESPTFITQHLNYNNEEDALISTHSYSDSEQFYLLSGSQYEESVYIDLDELHWHPAREICLVGSCNGVICLRHIKSTDVALWNPALKQLRPLPLQSFFGRYEEALSSGNRCSYFTMLGIDSKTNDYKVVSIALFFTMPLDGSEIEMFGNQVEVYSLREKTWRVIYEDGDLPFMDIKGNAVFSCKSGKCFWIAWDAEGSPMLLSFDFNGEVFGTMPFPDHHEKAYFYVHHFLSALDIHNETLVLIRGEGIINPGNGCSSFEIWMLNEFGVKESWTKMYKTGPLANQYPIIPTGLSGNGDFLISISCNFDANPDAKKHVLYLHNLGTQEGIFLPFSRFGSTLHYNASLISIKSANVEEIEDGLAQSQPSTS